MCFLPERGPLTEGFERWANLPPTQVNLQSFGHASVSSEGDLTIKLMTIDGEVQYEKMYKASDVTSTNGDHTDDGSSKAEDTGNASSAATVKFIQVTVTLFVVTMTTTILFFE